MKYKKFNDFDAFASNVRDVDSVMMLQNPKYYSWNIAQMILDGIEVQWGCLGSGNIVEGQSWPNGYLIYLPLTEACPYSANGQLLDKYSFMILEPGCEFCLSSNAEHDWCSIFVPTEKITDGRGLELLSNSEKMRCRVSVPNSELAKQFYHVMSEIITTAANCSSFETSPAGKCARAELLKLAPLILGQKQASKPKKEGRPKFSRQEIIRRCKDLLEELNGKPVVVEELATAGKVSERTLRTAFKEYFGVAPVRYLQLRQLHQVHHGLKVAEPEAVSVSELLLQHGVWEIGRFASRYRRLFGELPSDTLGIRRVKRIMNYESEGCEARSNLNYEL